MARTERALAARGELFGNLLALGRDVRRALDAWRPRDRSDELAAHGARAGGLPYRAAAGTRCARRRDGAQ